MSEDLDRGGVRVLLATSGSDGDVLPFIGLAVSLREAGFDVGVATYELFGERVR